MAKFEKQLSEPLCGEAPEPISESRGLIAIVVSTILGVLVMSTQSYLFSGNPQLTTWQLLFLRCGISSCLLISMLGRQFKQQMWDKVESQDLSKLSIRLTLASFGIPMNLLALQYFPASIVRAGMSTQPIMAAILAWFMLGEASTTRDFISIGITLVAVYLIMAVQVKQDIEQVTVDQATWWFRVATFGIFLQPLLQATSRVQVKQIKSMSAITISCYLNILLVLISIAGLYFARPGERWGTLDWPTYGLIVMLSLGMVIMQMNRLIAVKHLTTNRMSVFMQMGLLIQLGIDIFFLGKSFELVQFVGFALFLCLYLVLFADICFEQHRKSNSQDVVF